jgi:2-dehydro-3-deoxygluconokinase
MEKDIDILALGEAMYELSLRADGTFLPGFGGDTSNCVIAAARHGARCAYATKVGDDFFGDALIDLWMKEGIDINHVGRHTSAPTGLYFVIVKPGGHEFIYRRQGSAASLMSVQDVPADLIRRSKVLHVSGISQAISRTAEECVATAIGIARAHGTLVSYDTNFRRRLWDEERARGVIAAAMALADVALPSEDDMSALFGTTSPDRAIDRCLDLGAAVVAMTLGARGAMVADRERRLQFPALPVSVVDATGAGDAFDGAFLAEYLRTGGWARAGAYACAAASLSTQHPGAVAGLPTRAQTLAAMEVRSRQEEAPGGSAPAGHKVS